MRILTTYEMQDFIQFLTNVFIKEYNKRFSFGEIWIESSNILANGYCFYFALTVHKLVPETKIAVYPGMHHFISYHDEFFDYRGLLPVMQNQIQIFLGSTVSLDHIFIIEEKDLMQEIGIAETYGEFSTTKDAIWSQIEPVLLAAGQEYLENCFGFSLAKKIPQN